jgi:hypothetical protein
MGKAHHLAKGACLAACRDYPCAGVGDDLRRWVVERTIAWLQKCRAQLIRYDEKPQNYKRLIQLACALLWYRRLHRLNHADRVSG